MRNRATSEVSTHSSLEFSSSDVESIGSHLDMVYINIEKDAHPASPVLAPPTLSTKFAKVDLGEFDTPQPDQNMIASKTKKQEIQIQIATLERDAIYFCETVVLVVEDRVFCVPKGGLLEHGTYFQSLFGNQLHNDVKDGIPITGSSEQCPIVLGGITKIHFHNFLRVIYPFYGVDVPCGDEHWLGILDLATKWNFREVRKTALVQLEHLFTSQDRNPVRALYLCQKYDIQKYIQQQFEVIITSIKPLDSSAMLAGGISTETVLLLMGMSNRWMSGMLWGGKRSDTDTSNIFPRRMSAQKIVEEHFAALNARPLLLDEAIEATLIQDEEKRLEDEVEWMGKAQMDGTAVAEEAVWHDATDHENGCVEPESRSRQSEKLLEDESAGNSNANEDIPNNNEMRIKKLILLHRDKYLIAKQVQRLQEIGFDESPMGIQLLNIVEHHDQTLQRYWGKVSEVLEPHSPDVLANNMYSVDLVRKSIQESRQEIEKAIQKLLHPDAKSFSLSVSFGTNKISVPCRKSAVNEVLNRFGLLPYTRDVSEGKYQLTETRISEEEFGNWLGECKRLSNLQPTSKNEGLF